MADRETFQGGDHLIATELTSATTTNSIATRFSEFLFSNDDDVEFDMGGHQNHVHDHHYHPLHYYSSSIENPPPKMLCFGGYNQSESEFVRLNDQIQGIKITPQLSGVTCSNSSSASSGNNKNINNTGAINNANSTISKSNRKRNGSSHELFTCNNSTAIAKTPQRSSKKTKTENPTSTGHGKVRKEKLGERITALQQLVSPFGKTDAASVLHEAMGYIRFLHDQVQVLCSPYLQHHQHQLTEGGEESRKDLRSRGLCLVPVECTVHLASSSNIGADYWSPAMGNHLSSLSTTKQ